MADKRKMAISRLLDEGADMTEENIQAVMNSMTLENDFDNQMADQMIKALQSIREKSDLPKAIQVMAQILQTVLSGGFDKLAAAFREHGHSITVNPTPLNIERPQLPMVQHGGNTRFVINRDMNGFIESVNVVEDE